MSGRGRGELGWRARLGIRAGAVVLRGLAATWRYSFTNRRVVDDLHARREPFVYALWHGQLLPLLWLHRGEGVRVLISEHRDGEIVARIAESLGYETVRGSTGKRGERALLALVRALQAGEVVAVTPDGPRGPAEKFQPGALIAAARARAPIVPIVAQAGRSWRLRSWDRFMVPKPFARVAVAYGEPVRLEATSARAAATQGERLERTMRDTAARAVV